MNLISSRTNQRGRRNRWPFTPRALSNHRERRSAGIADCGHVGAAATLPDGPAIVNAHNKIAIVDISSLAATERSVSNLDTFAACGPVLNKQCYGRLVKADQNAGTRENEKLLIQSFKST